MRGSAVTLHQATWSAQDSDRSPGLRPGLCPPSPVFLAPHTRGAHPFLGGTRSGISDSVSLPVWDAHPSSRNSLPSQIGSGPTRGRTPDPGRVSAAGLLPTHPVTTSDPPAASRACPRVSLPARNRGPPPSRPCRRAALASCLSSEQLAPFSLVSLPSMTTLLGPPRPSQSRITKKSLCLCKPYRPTNLNT